MYAAADSLSKCNRNHSQPDSAPREENGANMVMLSKRATDVIGGGRLANAAFIIDD
jgi:hypothetical protein